MCVSFFSDRKPSQICLLHYLIWARAFFAVFLQLAMAAVTADATDLLYVTVATIAANATPLLEMTVATVTAYATVMFQMTMAAVAADDAILLDTTVAAVATDATLIPALSMLTIAIAAYTAMVLPLPMGTRATICTVCPYSMSVRAWTVEGPRVLHGSIFYYAQKKRCSADLPLGQILCCTSPQP